MAEYALTELHILPRVFLQLDDATKCYIRGVMEYLAERQEEAKRKGGL